MGEGCTGTGLTGGATGALVLGRGDAHATSMPTMAKLHNALSKPYNCMLLILLEALGAGLLLVLIVWWTMFHGRQGGELDNEHHDAPDQR